MTKIILWLVGSMLVCLTLLALAPDPPPPPSPEQIQTLYGPMRSTR